MPHVIHHPPVHGVDPRHTMRILHYLQAPSPCPLRQAPSGFPRRRAARVFLQPPLAVSSLLSLLRPAILRHCHLTPLLRSRDKSALLQPHRSGPGVGCWYPPSRCPGGLATPYIILPLVALLNLSAPSPSCTLLRNGHLLCGGNGTALPAIASLPSGGNEARRCQEC